MPYVINFWKSLFSSSKKIFYIGLFSFRWYRDRTYLLGHLFYRFFTENTDLNFSLCKENVHVKIGVCVCVCGGCRPLYFSFKINFILLLSFVRCTVFFFFYMNLRRTTAGKVSKE